MTSLPPPPAGRAGTRERGAELRAFAAALAAETDGPGPVCVVDPADLGRWAILDGAGGLALGSVDPLFAEFGRSAAALLALAAAGPLPDEPATIAVRLGVARPNGERIALLRAARAWMSAPLVSFEWLVPPADRPTLTVGGWLTQAGAVAPPLDALVACGSFCRPPAQLRAAPGDLARRLLAFADATSCRPAGADGAVRLTLPFDGLRPVLGIADQRARRVRNELVTAADYLRTVGYASATRVEGEALILVRSRPLGRPDSTMPGRISDRASGALGAPVGA
jgi:hypothetical protein